MNKLKLSNLFFIIFLVVLFFIASCAKNEQNKQSTEGDEEFKKMCAGAGYEWMHMKPTKDGKFMKDAQECWGCMVEGIEHICNKGKFIQFLGNNKNSAELLSVEFKTIPDKINAKDTATLMFKFEDAGGKPLKLKIGHEKLVHVIVINEDFSIFFHVHPEDSILTTNDMKNGGIYTINYTFSKAGKYLIGADFAADNQEYSKIFYVDVAGNKIKLIAKNLSRQEIFGGYIVNLSLPQKIAAGKETTLLYHFAKDNKPLTEMEPYLGAPMHIAIIKDDLTGFIHTHAMIPDNMPMMNHAMADMSHMGLLEHFGPDLMAHVTFPEKGFYIIFGEFKHNDKAVVTKFRVEVE